MELRSLGCCEDPMTLTNHHTDGTEASDFRTTGTAPKGDASDLDSACYSSF